MPKWLLASSFVGNMVSDAISHGAVFFGGILAAHGVFANCTAAEIAAGGCGDYQKYLGSAIFLGGLAWKWAENRAQASAPAR